jgi:maleamate amidohydrolase
MVREMTGKVHGFGNSAVRELYARAGFGGRVGWGERPALLVIDMAKAWVDSTEQLGADLSDVLGSIVRLLEVARRKGLPIYFTTMAYDPAMREVGAIVLLKTPHTGKMVRGSDRVQLADALERRGDEPLIEKPRASAFYGTNLRSMLQSDGVDTVIVTGCSTSGCIRASAESAFNENLRVIVPAKAVGDRSPTAHEANLFDIDARYGDVVSLEGVWRWTLVTDRRTIVATATAPAPGGAYSQAVISGSMVATAGQVGIDPRTGLLASGLEAQVRQAHANVTAVLEASGCTWHEVIKTTCFLADIDDFSAFNAIYAALVPEPRPARSTVGVRLAGDLLVEIEALAIRPEPPPGP